MIFSEESSTHEVLFKSARRTKNDGAFSVTPFDTAINHDNQVPIRTGLRRVITTHGSSRLARGEWKSVDHCANSLNLFVCISDAGVATDIMVNLQM